MRSWSHWILYWHFLVAVTFHLNFGIQLFFCLLLLLLSAFDFIGTLCAASYSLKSIYNGIDSFVSSGIRWCCWCFDRSKNDVQRISDQWSDHLDLIVVALYKNVFGDLSLVISFMWPFVYLLVFCTDDVHCYMIADVKCVTELSFTALFSENLFFFIYDPQMTKYGHIIGFTIDSVSNGVVYECHYGELWMGKNVLFLYE